MYKTITISGFRAIEHLRLTGLERVNLVVGTNNSGKTSVLEAIEQLVTGGSALRWALRRRGEFVVDPSTRRVQSIDVSSLLHNRQQGSAACAVIVGDDESGSGSEIELCLDDAPGDDDGQSADQQFSLDAARRLVVRFWGEPGRSRPPHEHHISVRGHRLVGGDRAPSDVTGDPYVFVTTASLSQSEVIVLFDGITLGEHEEIVLSALRIIEPGLARIASIGSVSGSWSPLVESILPPQRGGIVVNIEGRPPRLPIASMGDGIWRLLGLVLSLVHARGGVLLIDEIDTGLHHTVMVQMWRLVIETAEKLDVQVFATTHSSDCWTSLAQVIEERRADGRSTSAAIHRLERGRPWAVTFSEPEIVVAAQRELEVR